MSILLLILLKLSQDFRFNNLMCQHQYFFWRGSKCNTVCPNQMWHDKKYLFHVYLVSLLTVLKWVSKHLNSCMGGGHTINKANWLQQLSTVYFAGLHYTCNFCPNHPRQQHVTISNTEFYFKKRLYILWCRGRNKQNTTVITLVMIMCFIQC